VGSLASSDLFVFRGQGSAATAYPAIMSEKKRPGLFPWVYRKI